jgi:CheY-like chemotaxis protein
MCRYAYAFASCPESILPEPVSATFCQIALEQICREAGMNEQIAKPFSPEEPQRVIAEYTG